MNSKNKKIIFSWNGSSENKVTTPITPAYQKVIEEAGKEKGHYHVADISINRALTKPLHTGTISPLCHMKPLLQSH